MFICYHNVGYLVHSESLARPPSDTLYAHCVQYCGFFPRVPREPFPLFIFLFFTSGIESGSCARELRVIVDTLRRFTGEVNDYVGLELLGAITMTWNVMKFFI